MSVAEPEVGYGKRWWSTLNALEPVETARTCSAVEQFLKDPDHPSLNLHPLTGDGTKSLYTFRATKELRVLLVKRGNVYVLLEVGHHDEIYDRAPRLQFTANPHTGFVDLLELTDRDSERTQGATAIDRTSSARPTRDDAPRPLDHWTDAELIEVGCADEDVHAIRACLNEDDLCELPAPLFELIFEIIELTPDEWRNPPIDIEEKAAIRLRESISEHGALAGFTKLLPADEAAALIKAPVEDWMVFLHPEQRSTVMKRYSGPARVRGSAGTGKTVVGLHRAAELADRYRDEGGFDDPPGQPILFTTFIRSLPPVFEHLYERIPGARPEDVEFVNVDKLVSRICREAGDDTPTSTRDIDAAFASAWKSVVTTGSPIQRARLTRNYLREEIAWVIKGRGLTSLEEYLDVERTGRSTPFGQALREQAWSLREAWDREMDARGTVDFPDRVRRAVELVRSQPARYRAAIIDEAQDVTMVGLQFVRGLVTVRDGVDRPDGLLIVGDGAQRIYPGGYTLQQAGVEVRGRTTVLRANYRNTAEVLDAAMAVTGAGHVDDLAETYRRDDEHATVGRFGVAPRLVLLDDSERAEDEAAYIAAEIDALLDHDEALDYGDIAVATSTNKQAEAMYERLRAAGLPCQPLEQYEGVPTPAVKVGTHFRIKGLEFKVVLLPGLAKDEFPRPPARGQAPDEYAEQCERSLSQLFVAMTRARDLLYVISRGEPGAAIADASDRFEVVTVDA